MNEIVIDWKEVETDKDFYEIFLPQVRAPEWHGHNLDALSDSIVTGDINGLEPPYTVLNKNTRLVIDSMKEFQKTVLSIFEEALLNNREINLITD